MGKLKKLFRNPKLFFYDFALKRGLTEQRSIVDCFKEITEFAQYYDVNSIKIENEFIWPYIRNHMWVNLNLISIGKNYRRAINSIGLQNGHPSQIPISFRERVKNEFNACDVEELSNKKVDFLFFTQIGGTEQININSKIYYRITDPLYEAAQKIGKASKIEIIKSKNAREIEKWHNYTHKSKLILPPIIQTSGYTFKMKMNATFFNRWKYYVPSLILTNKRQLDHIVNYELHTRKFYIDLLKKIKPKVILLHGFHYYAPLISAADELGIVTVDLQHGLQVGWNPLYNNYDEVPRSGYQALPDYFAVWGEKEYRNIENIFKSSKHKPVYLGNPWLEKIEQFSATLPNELIEKMANYKTKILIMMQNQTTIPSLFLKIIEISGNDILWVVRHHPKGEKYKETDFSSRGNVLIDPVIDAILINTLFKHVDIAVSEGSALATEAYYFGVHNIIIDAVGRENYQEEISKGIFDYINNAKDFQKILERTHLRKHISNTGRIKKINSRQFLLDLLESPKKPKIPNTEIYIKPYEEKISTLCMKMWEAAEKGTMEEALNLFFELRHKLEETPNLEKIYESEEDLWRKEAKIFKRYTQKKTTSNENAIVLVGDSLELPRPKKIPKDIYKIEETTTFILNNLKNHNLNVTTWAQRYLTTEKLLSDWSTITEDIKGKHLVVHLGLNDSAERIFLEKQRLAMRAYDPTLQSQIIKFGQKYRKEILENQKNHSYVPYNDFLKNIQMISQKAMSASVKSLTFINIITSPQFYNKSTPRSVENTEQYNNVLKFVSNDSSKINIIDINALVQKNFVVYMNKDNMHLSHKGHIILSDKILKTLKV